MLVVGGHVICLTCAAPDCSLEAEEAPRTHIPHSSAQVQSGPGVSGHLINFAASPLVKPSVSTSLGPQTRQQHSPSSLPRFPKPIAACRTPRGGPLTPPSTGLLPGQEPPQPKPLIIPESPPTLVQKDAYSLERPVLHGPLLFPVLVENKEFLFSL